MYSNKLKRVLFLFGLIVITLGGFLLGGCSSITEKTITISSIKDVSVNIGEGKNVTVVTTSQDVSIKAVSHNPNISSVAANGKVLTITGIAEGQAEITITASKVGYKTSTVKFKVNVVGSHNITNISLINDLKVSYGTSFEELDLPSTVEVTLDDGTKKSLEVTWSEGNYDANLAGTYELEGTLILVNGITNTESLKVVIQIIVNQVPIITNFTPGGSALHQGETIELSVIAEDPDNDQLTYRWEVNEESINGEENSNLSWTFSEGVLTEITVYVSDGFNEVYQTQSFEVNATPEITSFTASKYYLEIGQLTTLTVTATDKEGEALNYRWELNETSIDGETGSNITWTATELGTFYFDVYVSDNSQIEANSQIEINVVENCVPKINDISGPSNVIVTQKGVKFIADYSHVDPNRELTVNWSASGGTITNGQGTGEIEWDAPTEEGFYTLTFSVSDGVTTIQDYINVWVNQPTINIFYIEPALAGKENNISINVSTYFGADIQFSATTTDGDLTIDYAMDNSGYYVWVVPETVGVASIIFETTINGVVFSETREITIIQNDPPIIQNVLVNNNPIDINVNEFLILNANESYNFGIDVFDPDGDIVGIEWTFLNCDTSDFNQYIGSAVDYISNMRSVVGCKVVVTDGYNVAVMTDLFIIFEDYSFNDLTDPIQVQAIETICDDFALMLKQNNLDIMEDHLHPNRELDLIREFEEMLEFVTLIGIDRINSSRIIFDSSNNIFTIYVLYDVEYFSGESEYSPLPLYFKQDDNGEMKLYGFLDMK